MAKAKSILLHSKTLIATTRSKVDELCERYEQVMSPEEFEGRAVIPVEGGGREDVDAHALKNETAALYDPWALYLCGHCGQRYSCSVRYEKQKARQHQNTFACRYGGAAKKLKERGFIALNSSVTASILSEICKSVSIEVVEGHREKRNSIGEKTGSGRYERANWIPLWAFTAASTFLIESPKSVQQLTDSRYEVCQILKRFLVDPSLQDEIVGAYNAFGPPGVRDWFKQVGIR